MIHFVLSTADSTANDDDDDNNNKTVIIVNNSTDINYLRSADEHPFGHVRVAMNSDG